MRAKLKFLTPRALNVTRPLAPISSWSNTTLAKPIGLLFIIIISLLSPFNLINHVKNFSTSL